MPISRRVGIGLLVIVAVSWIGWTFWARTRNWCPVDLPFSPVQFTRIETPEFVVNVTGRYEISVSATGNKNLPLNRVVCLMGMAPLWPEKTCPVEGILKASWVLTSDGKTFAQGTSDASRGGGSTAEGWSEASRDIGDFYAAKGQAFRLQVTILSDASKLLPANPHLTVSSGDTQGESVLVFTGLINVASFLFAATAISLIAFSYTPKRRSGEVA